MKECDFSWFKMASFFGALVLVVLMFMAIAGGIYLITGGMSYNGVACILGGVLLGAAAVWVYQNYQNKGNH